MPFTFRLLARLSIAAALAGALLPGTALAGTHVKSDGAPQPALLYHNYCSVCHGDKGDGRSRAQFSLHPAPRDFTSVNALQLPRARMIDSVTNGRSGTAMTAWKSQLSAVEIAALVDYIQASFMPAAPNAAADRGRSIYRKTCAVCHGDNGDGRSRAQASLHPAPRDFTAPAARAELTEQRMIDSVTYGRADTAMAGFKTQLSSDDIRAVVAFIRNGFMAQADISGISGTQHGRRQGAPDGAAVPLKPAAAPAPKPALPVTPALPITAPMPQGLKGNMNKGTAFYMSNCATCHGTSGDGRGPRAYFINPKPRNFLHPASRAQLNRVVLFGAISNGKLGTEMPAWGQVLSAQEVADVAEFVYQRFITAPAAGEKK
jgi:mono/diheme cytochrome c family protein